MPPGFKSRLLRQCKYQLLIQRLVLFFYPMVVQKPLLQGLFRTFSRKGILNQLHFSLRKQARKAKLLSVPVFFTPPRSKWRIVGKALREVRQNVVIATKLFLNGTECESDEATYNASRKHLEASLERLQTDYVDIYYLHRTGSAPLDRIARAMGKLIEDGLIRGWGLSQVDVPIIDKAHRITPLTAVQNIYSVVERDAEQRVIPYCLENGIGFVPFSPIASGLLSGKITAETKFEKNDDVRNWVPQLSKQNIVGNQPIVDILKEYAEKKNATPAQISLAWMLHKYPNVVPIPGSKNKERIIENLNASEVELTESEFVGLEDALGKCRIYGHRGLSGY